jgi:hypothetical protein
MDGAQVVIDLANSPSFEDKTVLEFFETSGWVERMMVSGMPEISISFSWATLARK